MKNFNELFEDLPFIFGRSTPRINEGLLELFAKLRETADAMRTYAKALENRRNPL